MRYELLLTAVALNNHDAEALLPAAWDPFLHLRGRPLRFDLGGLAARQPDFARLDAAPECIQSVWRDPVAARKSALSAQDNSEIQSIVEADQAVRHQDWNKLTQAELTRIPHTRRGRSGAEAAKWLV